MAMRNKGSIHLSVRIDEDIGLRAIDSFRCKGQ